MPHPTVPSNQTRATPAPPPRAQPDIDSSYSSVIQELLHQALSASQSQGGGAGARQQWATSSAYQDSLDSAEANLLQLSGDPLYQPTSNNILPAL